MQQSPSFPLNALAEMLDTLSIKESTGILSIFSSDGSEEGVICLAEGKMVHASVNTYFDAPAVYYMLTWESASSDWSDNQPPPQFSCHKDIPEILFEYSRMERLLGSKKAILNYLAEEPHKKTQQVTVVLPSFEHYSFYLESLDHTDSMFEIKEGGQVIGSSSQADIVLSNSTVSRNHCCIIMNKDSISISDLHSTNGTFVNGNIILEALIIQGDLIHFGQAGFKLVAKLRESDTQKSSSSPRSKQTQQVTISNPSSPPDVKTMTKVIHHDDIVAAHKKNPS